MYFVVCQFCYLKVGLTRVKADEEKKNPKKKLYIFYKPISHPD